MKVAIFHYASFLKGAYSTYDVSPTTTLGEIMVIWKPYFKNPNLKVWKFKVGKWAEPYTGNWMDSYFTESTTIQEYMNFYGTKHNEYVNIIFC
jgi:hypothetical protein